MTRQTLFIKSFSRSLSRSLILGFTILALFSFACRTPLTSQTDRFSSSATMSPTASEILSASAETLHVDSQTTPSITPLETPKPQPVAAFDHSIPSWIPTLTIKGVTYTAKDVIGIIRTMRAKTKIDSKDAEYTFGVNLIFYNDGIILWTKDTEVLQPVFYFAKLKQSQCDKPYAELEAHKVFQQPSLWRAGYQPKLDPPSEQRIYICSALPSPERPPFETVSAHELYHLPKSVSLQYLALWKTALEALWDVTPWSLGQQKLYLETYTPQTNTAILTETQPLATESDSPDP